MNKHCSICLEENLTGDIRTLPCNHAFHTKCFAEWSNKSIIDGEVSCPYCRKSLPDPFECYRSIEILPGTTEVVYRQIEVPSERYNYSKCAAIFLSISIVQFIVMYSEFRRCS